MSKTYGEYEIINILNSVEVRIGLRGNDGNIADWMHIKKKPDGADWKSSVHFGGVCLSSHQLNIRLEMHIENNPLSGYIEETCYLIIRPNDGEWIRSEHETWRFRLVINEPDFDELKAALKETSLNPTIEYVKDPDLVIPDGYALPDGESYDDVSDMIYDQYGEFDEKYDY